MTQTRIIPSVGGADHMIVEWESIIAAVVMAMRHNLNVFAGTAAAMTPSAQFQQLRMFSFRGGRQMGKSMGITEYMRKHNQCMLHDTITGSSYILNDGSSGDTLKLAGKHQTLKTAFEIACKGGVETFFISSFDEDIVQKMTNVFIELKDIVPAKMIVVIEN